MFALSSLIKWEEGTPSANLNTTQSEQKSYSTVSRYSARLAYE
jgi:hypothetical protein